jgi:hypothetical protein
VESVARAEVPVVPALLGDPGADQRTRIAVTPALAQVRGRPAVIAGVMAVVVPLPVGSAIAGSSQVVAGYAVDRNGLPLAEVSVEPVLFTLEWGLEAVWALRRLPLELLPVTASGWSLEGDAPFEVAVFGPPGTLATLAALVADVDLPTDDVAPGRYTRPLNLRLPVDVVAAETPTVVMTYTAPSPPE